MKNWSITAGNTVTLSIWYLELAGRHLINESIDSRHPMTSSEGGFRYMLKVQMPAPQQVFGGCVGNGFDDLFFCWGVKSAKTPRWSNTSGFSKFHTLFFHLHPPQKKRINPAPRDQSNLLIHGQGMTCGVYWHHLFSQTNHLSDSR